MAFKFYKDADGDSLEKESEVYDILIKSDKKSIHEAVFPQLIARGKLTIAEKQVPYLVTSILPGDCLQEDYDELSPFDLSHIAKFLGRTLKILHSLPLEKANLFKGDWDPFVTFLENQKSNSLRTHQLTGTISKHLLNQLNSFLPQNILSIIDKGSNPVFLHGDITDENLLGIALEPENEQAHNEVTWSPSGIIDFGDARVGDPIYDFISLHIACFRCDKQLFAEFLKSYGFKDWDKTHAYRAMCYSLLHPCDAMRSVYQWKPEYKKVKDLHTLTAHLWDISQP